LDLLPDDVKEAVFPALERIGVRAGETLYEPGQDVTHAYFPLNAATAAYVLPMRDGSSVEACTIGREGALGGVISLGFKPAYARAVVRLPGDMARIPLARLEAAKRVAPKLHDRFSRYADCLVAQILQSVGCASLHPLDARCARWLLTMHDRLGSATLPITQDSLAEMFGVARTYMTRIARGFQEAGIIAQGRGAVEILDRARLEETACECYHAVKQHFDRVLPGLYPSSKP